MEHLRKQRRSWAVGHVGLLVVLQTLNGLPLFCAWTEAESMAGAFSHSHRGHLAGCHAMHLAVRMPVCLEGCFSGSVHVPCCCVWQATGAPAAHKAASKTARKWAAAATSSRPAAQASTAAVPLSGSSSSGNGSSMGVAALDSNHSSARVGSGGQATTSRRPIEVSPGPQRLGRKGQPMTLVLRLKGGKVGAGSRHGS